MLRPRFNTRFIHQPSHRPYTPKVGDAVWYRGGFGADAPKAGVIFDIDEKDGQPVYDVRLAGGDFRWGRADQFSRR